MKSRHKSRGFTAVELAVVMAMLGVLGNLLPAVQNAQRFASVWQENRFIGDLAAKAVGDLNGAERDLAGAMALLGKGVPDRKVLLALHAVFAAHVEVLRSHEDALMAAVPQLGGNKEARDAKGAVIELHNHIVHIRTQVEWLEHATHKLVVLSDEVLPE